MIFVTIFSLSCIIKVIHYCDMSMVGKVYFLNAWHIDIFIVMHAVVYGIETWCVGFLSKVVAYSDRAEKFK